MRGIPESVIFFFFAVVFIIELLAFFAITQLLEQPKTKRKVSFIYWTLSFILIVILAFAFMDPSKLRQTTNYQFFYFVISISFFNLIPKALLSVGYLGTLMLRAFRAKYYARIWLMGIVVLSLGAMLTIGYGITFGPKSLRIINQEVYFNNLPKALDKMVVVQISDFHLGSFENDRFLKRTTQEINKFNPDLILFTGDMVNNYYQEMQGFEEELTNMKATYGKFAILGNHDYGDYSDWESENKKNLNHQKLESKIEKSGFILLLNQSAEVMIHDEPVEIIGVENWGNPPFPQYADLNKAMKNTEKQSFKILMTHDPAYWSKRVIGKTTIPLTLSGHTHAAQSGIQFAGIEFSPMYFIQKYWGGLYQQQDQFLYVNRGLGCVGLLGRIEMNPEITVLTLRSK